MVVSTVRDGCYVRAEWRCGDKKKLSCKIRLNNFWRVFSQPICMFQVARTEQHSRQTRAALKPLGFFGKLAYMGGLLFQVHKNNFFMRF